MCVTRDSSNGPKTKTNIKSPVRNPKRHITICERYRDLCQQFTEEKKKKKCFALYSENNANELLASSTFKTIAYYSHFERIRVIGSADTAPRRWRAGSV